MSGKSAVKKRATRPAAKRASVGKSGKAAGRRQPAAGATPSRGAKPRGGKTSVAAKSAARREKSAARREKPAVRRKAGSARAVSGLPPTSSAPRVPIVVPVPARKAIEPVRPPVPDRPVFQDAAPPRKSETPRTTPPPRRSRAGLTEEDLLRAPASQYMNVEQLAFFRERLIDMQRELLEKADLTSEHLRAHEIEPDPTDQATIEEEYALELRTRDRERKLLKKIDEALRRIDDGSYGYCEETGEPIGLPRLLARPTATLSVEAQARRELKQKLYGD